MVSFCEGLRMPVPWMPQPHPASAGVGKPARHEVAEGRVGGRSGLYGDLMPGAGRQIVRAAASTIDGR
jgi:hypothetical protein